MIHSYQSWLAMLNAEYTEPTVDEIIAELDTAAHDYFHCSLAEFIKKLDANELPHGNEIIIDMMKSWIKAIPRKHELVKHRYLQLSVAAR
jgi:hypothetical protein